MVFQYNGRVNKSLLRVALLLGVALGLALAAMVTRSRLSPAAPCKFECPPTDIPLAVDKSLGVNSDLSLLTVAGREETLSAMRSADFHWLRQRFPWDKIESVGGQYEWDTWDAIVDDATRHGMKLIAVLDGSPDWARSSEDSANPLAPPHEFSDYGAYVAAFASRYADQIDYYQLWDEPNISPHWGSRWVDPAAYLRLLREGAIQVRTADSGSAVILAALAPNVEQGGANMSDVLFLDTLYALGAAQWFDVVAAEPYGFDQEARRPASQDVLSFSRVELLRAVMQGHGDLSSPIWAVAFGWQEDTASAYPASENAHAAVDYAREEWPWMGPMLWAAWSPRDARGQYALLHPGGEASGVLGTLPGPGYEPRIASTGWYPADHPSGRYEGGWRITPAGADIGATGDRLTISFSGSRLDMTLRRGDYRAFLYVAIDGQPANALPRDGDGRSYLSLYDPRRDTATVTLAKGLAPGEHFAELVAEGGWGQWAIVGWSVCRETPYHVPWLPAGLATGSVLALGIALCSVWPKRQALLRAGQQLVARYRALDDRLVWLIGVAAGVCVFVSVGTLPSLTALALLATLVVFRPEVGLSLIALALPFWQPGKPLLGKVFSMVEILTWLTVAGCVANWALGRCPGHAGRTPLRSSVAAIRSRLGWLSALDWGVISLVLIGFLSLLWAEHVHEAARELRTVVVGSALFYFLLRAMARGRPKIWHVVDSWILGAALVSLVAVGQWLFGQNLISAEGVWRVRGFYGSPNNLALYLGRMLPLAVAIGLWGVVGRRRWLYGAAALLCAAAIVLTYSRGAWLLGVPLSLLFLAALRGRRPLLVAGGVVLAAVVLLAVLVGAGRIVSLTDMAQGTTFLRLQLWQSSVTMIRDHPFLGVGLDNFLYAYRSTYALPVAWEELNLSHPHNLVLDFWLRLGLPGLVAIGFLLVAFFRQGRRLYKRFPEDGERLLALGLMAGMVDFLAHGLVDNAFFLVDLAFVFMLMVALVQNLADEPVQTVPLRPVEQEKCVY